MSHLKDATEAVLAAATAAGLRVTADPRNVNPPTILVTPTTTVRRTTAQVAVTLDLQLIAPGPANLDAIGAVDVLAGQLTPALDVAGIPWTSGSVESTPSPSSGEALLTYRLTVTVPIHT